MEPEIVRMIEEMSPDLSAKSIKKTDVVFEERVHLKCLFCQRYDKKWTCPPKIPNLDYKKIISEYEHLLFVYYKAEFNRRNFAEIREDSSFILHNTLLHLEKYLWNKGFFLSTSFIGGSCRLCKEKCSDEICQQPAKARIPIEALGVNVVKTAKNAGLDIRFPITKIFYRVGLLLW